MLLHTLICLHVLVILYFTVELNCSRSWGAKQIFPADRISDAALDPKRQIVRRKITLYHNFFRTKVRPSASNMLLMSWHSGAARQAQQYAEKCVFLQHNDPAENSLPRLGTCGQNLFVSSQKAPWFFALKNWFVEYKNFTYADPVVHLTETGHYTQMVWATSHKVGCGLAHCLGGPWGQFYNYVCHYCPGGNYNTITQFPYQKGKSCAACPNNCVSGTLCNNPCSHRDIFSNCGELVQTLDGYCKQGMCNATCECGNQKIHKNYPW